MLTELYGKSGTFCQPAKDGKIRCPLNVRPTSEDVITGELFGVLSVLNPRWWLPDLLNHALDAQRFRRQVFRKFKVSTWEKQTEFPREFILWKEGRTEVDALLRWENPQTTVFVEMKYKAKLSPSTTHHSGNNGFASDQLIRNIRIALWKQGYYRESRLFEIPKRDLVVLLVTPHGRSPLVAQYRDLDFLRTKLPRADQIELPNKPFLGELSYRDIVRILRRQQRWFLLPEQKLIDRLCAYLEMKLRVLKRQKP